MFGTERRRVCVGYAICIISTPRRSFSIYAIGEDETVVLEAGASVPLPPFPNALGQVFSNKTGLSQSLYKPPD